MLRTRILASISLVTGVLSLVCLLLVMLALQDIYYGQDPTMTAEWNIVRIALPVFLITHILSLVGTVFLLHSWGSHS